ncbi:MAG: peptidase M64 [Bacteroidales bacterium]|nr:peptidase M64 [Bacteroidales bacterium]
MKIPLLIALIFSILQALTQNIEFTDFFYNKTMRVDYSRAGNFNSERIFLEQIKEEPFWGGSQKNLIDSFNLGAFYFFVSDSASGKLLYSRGYCSLFQEWQATPEAKKTPRSFYESVVFPYPKNTIVLELKKRQKDNSFVNQFKLIINPNDYFIKTEKPIYSSEKIFGNGDPSVSVDIVFIPEGYTIDEMNKFKQDVLSLGGYMLEKEPFNQHKGKFNFWAVNSPSLESGTDVPGKDIWKNTIVNSNFYTFDSERYLTTQDIKATRDLAASAPYDQIYILVNTETYGGGGIFNYYNLTSASNFYSKEVFVHEFGHGFGGLADEYYDSEVSVEEYYTAGIEPWEPNITNLSNFEKKWKNMVDKKTPIPTPMNSKYLKTVGLFEGAGYTAKGMYRPYNNCTMKSLNAPEGFCPVCRKAISDMIKFYTE